LPSRVRRFEHVELGVPDVAEAVAFYRDVVGMTELASEGETVYLGFGLDDNYDLALSPGEGIRHFAFRAEDAEELAAWERRLDGHGIAHERRDGTEFGQPEAVRFELPSGHAMEFVLVEDRAYQQPAAPAHPRTSGILPLDNDHIGLMAGDVRALSEYFRDVLGFKLTEYVEPEEGSGFWVLGFVRSGPYHHDISIALGDQSLHHYAVTLSSFEHMKLACDTLAGCGHRIEFGPSRHPAGSNVFIYVWLPGGHRVEFSAEMALLDDSAPVRRLTSETSLDAWGDTWKRVPESFYGGS
jgi:catechol 2,3-dioxygenase